MTGEITLSGKVTPIGGVREKVIAALRAGIRDVVMPADNEKDLEDIPQEVRSRITFHFVRTIDEVLKIAMPKNVKPFVPKKSEVRKDEFYEYDDYLFQQVEPEAKKEKPVPSAEPESEAKKPEEKKPVEQPPSAEEKPAAKPADAPKQDDSAAKAEPEKKPAEPISPKPESEAKKPESEVKKPAEAVPPKPEAEAKKPEEKKPEHHSAPQFEFKKPTLVVNYGKFRNATLTIGSVPLKAPETHPQPEHKAQAPAESFKAREKLHLEVKIDTAKEAGDAPVISLEPPVETEKKAPAPVRKSAAGRPASKRFRSPKPLKLQVRVSASEPAKEKASAPAKKASASAAKKPASAKKASAPRKKAAPDKKG
jgi:hypothetical protein